MDNNDVLQDVVDSVYQKTLLSIPASVTSIADAVNDEFINNFIMFFKGSRLDSVPLLDPLNDKSRQKVIELFESIETDFYKTSNSTTDVSTLHRDMNTLNMYLDGRKSYDDVVKDAYHNVQNMAGANAEAAELVNKVNEKRQDIQAFMRQRGSSYDNDTREGIRTHFLENGLIFETTDSQGNPIDKIVPEEMQKRPSEVEELMNAVMQVVKNARTITGISDCRWAGFLSASGLKIGKEIVGSVERGDPIMHAYQACQTVAEASKERALLLKQNIVHNEETSLSYSGDPYMSLLFDMIKEGKVTKEPTGPITIVDATKITVDDIRTLYNHVKSALFNLGPIETSPVQFTENFDEKAMRLKEYIEFMNSREISSIVSQDKTLKSNMTKLIAAYILSKSVHDTFDGCNMMYSKTDVTMDDGKLPSLDTFKKAIDTNCKSFPNSDIDRDYIFDYKIMFTSEIPYFPIEQIVKHNPILYNLMVEYSRSCMDDFTSRVMEKRANSNIPVQHISGEFADHFNEQMRGVARIDEYCEKLKISTLVNPTQFADAFNAVSNGIAYASSKDINDTETEYRLWSILKTLASKTPEALGNDVKKEFINVSHVQEDLLFRLNLAISAGVLSKKSGYHFSGNFGTVTEGKNPQATRIDRIMKIFYAYIIGLRFIKTNAALAMVGYPRIMSMKLVKPYMNKIYELVKEYNIAFEENHAETLQCSREWSDKIISELERCFRRV